MVAETPQSVSFNLGRTNLTIKQKCGNCKHLKRIAHPAYQSVCKDLGMSEISAPCPRFSLDPTKLKTDDRTSRMIMEILQNSPDSGLDMLASLAMEQKRTRRCGFNIGQTVYLNAFGGEYLSNYYRMKVVSASKDMGRNYVNLVADKGFTAMVFAENVLTPEKWRKKKKWLIDHERLEDPKYKTYTKSATTAEMNSRKLKDKLGVLEFDATSKHDFSVTRGSMGGSKLSKYSDPSSHKSLLTLIKVR